MTAIPLLGVITENTGRIISADRPRTLPPSRAGGRTSGLQLGVVTEKLGVVTKFSVVTTFLCNAYPKKKIYLFAIYILNK
jgi:hypothetical protein